jgi:hypothetical protein
LRPAGREGVVNIPYTPTDKPQKALSVIHIGGLRGKTGNAVKEVRKGIELFNKRLEEKLAPEIPEPIFDELFVQSGNINDFIQLNPGALLIDDLDINKYPTYTIDDFLISYKEMERIRHIYPPTETAPVQTLLDQVEQKNEESPIPSPKPSEQGAKVFGWKDIQAVADATRPTITKAIKKVKVKNPLNSNGKNIWAYESEIRYLMTRYHETMNRKKNNT